MFVNVAEIEIASTTQDGITRLLVTTPKPCGICGQARALFVCRKGTTRCLECDEGFQKAETAMRAEAEASPAPGTAEAQL
jgi:hypothetical protein